MKAVVIILALVGVSFLALLVYGATRHEQPSNDCSYPKAFSKDDPDADDLSDYCPPNFAEKTRGLQARFAPGLGQDKQTVIIGSADTGLPVKAGKKTRAAKLKLVGGSFVRVKKGDDIVCLCAEGTPIPGALRNSCDSHWRREHTGLAVCQPGFDAASMPFDDKPGLLVFPAGPPAKVEVQ